MNNTNMLPHVLTPEQVADILQLSKNTVYDLIDRGEIIAKRFGRAYRIPAKSLSFVFTGLDADLYQAEQTDLKSIQRVQNAVSKIRRGRYFNASKKGSVRWAR